MNKLGTYNLNTVYNIDCIEGMRLIPNNSIDMILCDLPYGTTANKWDTIISFNLLWEQYERIIKDNGAIVLTAQTPFDKALGASNLKLLRYEWIWQKESGTGFLNAKKMPLKNHENILVFYKRLPVYNPQMREGFSPYTIKKSGHGTNYGKDKGAITVSNGERYPLSIIKFNRDGKKLHSTQKPVDLFRYLIRTYTNPNEIILDNCMGSGTTALAAEIEGRNWLGFELESKYVNITNQRLHELRTKGKY